MRRHIATRERMEIFGRASGLCHICGEKIDGTRDRWDVEHVIPLELGGDEAKGSDNLQPAHASCHRIKTCVDVWSIAKAKRREAKHHGATVSRSTIHGSRRSPFKKRIDGSVVRRGE